MRKTSTDFDTNENKILSGQYYSTKKVFQKTARPSADIAFKHTETFF